MSNNTRYCYSFQCLYNHEGHCTYKGNVLVGPYGKCMYRAIVKTD